MANLPTAADYGQRQDLGVRRMDQATNTGSELADAVISSASAFDSILKDKKQKQDRLSYALARNELQTADMDARTALAEDQDWQTHDEKYSTAYKDAADQIIARAALQGLSPDDLEILGSESGLISSQGRVDVGGNARKIQVAQGAAAYRESQFLGKKNLERAKDGASRNNIILGQLDLIEAAEEAGFLKPEEAAIERQTMTQDFALSAIKAMPDEEKIRVLEATLRYRRGESGDFGEYSEYINKAAREYGIPPQLIEAQIHKESSGNPNAKSGAFGDPTGLMQLGMDAAADMGVTDRTDPAQSIDGGTKYLAHQLKLFDGDKAKALAAYNWGRKKVLQAYDDLGDDWLSAAPDETKDYVERLLPVWEESSGFDTKGNYGSGEGPLTAEAIRNGEGTGFVSDFLPSDTAAVMLDQAKKTNTEDNNRNKALEGFDVARSLFPEDHDKRLEWIRDNLDGVARQYATTAAEQFENSQIAIKARKNQETVDFANKAIEESTRDNPFNHSSIPTEEWEDLTHEQQELIRQNIKAKQIGYSHADPGDTHLTPRGDGLKSIQDWMDLPEYTDPANPDVLGRDQIDLDQPEWKLAMDEETWLKYKAVQKTIQQTLKAGLSGPPQTLNQLVTTTLQSEGWFGVAGVDRRKEQKAMLLRDLQHRVRQEMMAKVPPRELFPEEINKLWNEQLQGTGTLGTGYKWNDEKGARVVEMTPEERRIAYIDVTEMQNDLLPKSTDEKLFGGYGKATYYNYMVLEQNKARKAAGYAALPEGQPDIRALERAYFAYKNKFPQEDIDARLRGD
jgi:soluble lytic murein transglycosylase-like protein